jgi:phage N-6-adenine-methyltransferase
MNPVHFSSETDNWSTPQDFFDKVAAEFGPFDLDPCADATNAKAPKFYTREDDGLSRYWRGKVWVNPPYGRGIGKWVELAARAVNGLCTADLVVMLLPARTDTKWWHDYVIPHASEIRFIKGRLKFGGARNSAPFPSALVVFRRPDVSSKEPK